MAKGITPEELEREYKRCLKRERMRYREWAKTRQGAFETYRIMHFDAEAEEAKERENSTSWLSDCGRGAQAIRTGGKAGRPQDRPDTRQKRIDRAKHLVMRKAPECLETFWLVVKNGKNRKESIWQMAKKMLSKRPANGRPRRCAIGTT